jgi:hypothetical protein
VVRRCASASVSAAKTFTPTMAGPETVGIFFHRDHCLRLDEYQWKVANFVLMQIFHFGKIDGRQLQPS